MKLIGESVCQGTRVIVREVAAIEAIKRYSDVL